MNDYQYWKPLQGPGRDVEAVRSVLTEHGFEVTVKMNLTGVELKKAIETFVNTYGLDGNKRILVYFAGHGHTLKSPDGRDLFKARLTASPKKAHRSV